MLLKDAIRTVGAKLAKAERRLAAMPADINRKMARDKLAITFEALVARARAGHVYEHQDRANRPAFKGKGDWRNANPRAYSVE